MQPYKASALATPNPDNMPDQRPRVRVRWMHNKPVGPTGAAMASPINIPLSHSNMFNLVSGFACSESGRAILYP